MKRFTISMLMLSALGTTAYGKGSESFRPADLPMDHLEAAQARSQNHKVRIGAEGREESDTTVYPFTAIGAISFKSGTSSYSCTGSMIAENVVLTNGHCVWDKENKRFYTGFKFSPAYQSGPGPLGTVGVKRVFVSKSYQNNRSDIDYGFLVLDTPIGRETGWFGTKIMKRSWYGKERFYVAGYGSNFGILSALINIQAVNKKPCEVSRQTLLARALVHNCDTGPGNSGSPLFTYENGKPYIVGVHFSGSSGDPVDASCTESFWPGVCENYATKTNIFLDVMNQIIKEYK